VEHLPFFVYGTLKTGEVRAGRWPHQPQKVEPATTRGVLYDLGPYPALTDGGDVVLGELWHITLEHMPETLAVLDRIEGFGVTEVDLYVRRVIPVILMDHSGCLAYAYFIADLQTLRGHRRVLPDKNGFTEWSGRPRSAEWR
jgi:gamma-glutamylcyclotransferase (GGCT)/AIG2-like uncharacterized protein YtfP